MGIDYYGVLNISRNSTDLEIKRAYRNLALEFNPERLKDQNTEKIFALIGEAYDVLGDSLRRAVFDQYGEEGLKRGVPGPKEYIQPYHYHGVPMKTYKDFFGTASPYADLLEPILHPRPTYDLPSGKGYKIKQAPIYHPLALLLHEVYFGGVKKMKLNRYAYTDESEMCTELREQILSIPIKPGLRPGTEIKFLEKGDQNPAHIAADIIFVTEDRPHEYFKRENDNLIMDVTVSLEDALLGTTITVNTLDHRVIRVNITDTISPGYERLIENEGMPILENPEDKGDLILRFSVEFPAYLPKASRDLMKTAFYLAKVGGGYKQHEMINKMVLADKMMRVDPEEQAPPI